MCCCGLPGAFWKRSEQLIGVLLLPTLDIKELIPERRLEASEVGMCYSILMRLSRGICPTPPSTLWFSQTTGKEQTVWLWYRLISKQKPNTFPSEASEQGPMLMTFSSGHALNFVFQLLPLNAGRQMTSAWHTQQPVSCLAWLFLPPGGVRPQMCANESFSLFTGFGML